MRKFEIEIQNYEGMLIKSGGISVGYTSGDNKFYYLSLEGEDTVRIGLNDLNTSRLLGTFEVGSQTISLIIGPGEDEREYTVDLYEVGQSHVFPTNPPIKFTKIPS